MSLQTNCWTWNKFKYGLFLLLRWLVVDLETSEDIVSFQDGPEQHDAIKYSPGKFQSVGSFAFLQF